MPACPAIAAYIALPMGTDLPDTWEEPEPVCAYANIDVAGRYNTFLREDGDDTFELSRGRAEAGWVLPGLGSTRFAAVQGYDPDGLAVPVIQIAEARLHWAAAGLTVAGGFVDGPWVFSGNQSWMRQIGPVMAQEQGWMARNDLGAILGWTASKRVVSVVIAGLNGAGGARVDDNEVPNVEAMLVFRPWAFVDAEASDTIELSLMQHFGVQPGTRSRGQTRTGGRLLASFGGFRPGLEVLQAAHQQTGPGLGLSAWVVAEPAGPLLAWARADQVRPTSGGDTSLVSRAGIGTRLPKMPERRQAHLVVGVEDRTEGQIAPGTMAFVQLGTTPLFVWDSAPAE